MVYNSSALGSGQLLPSNVRVESTSASSSVAAIDSAGHVTALAPGRVSLYLAGAGSEDSVTLTVRDTDPAARDFVSISAGGSHTCALARDGTAYCWGSSWFGQTGSGATRFYTSTVAPAPVRVPTQLVSVSAGNTHACGLDVRGVVWCWGDNAFGQARAGASQKPTGPVWTLLGDASLEVSAGGDHTCVLAVSGGVSCWGRGRNPRTTLRPSGGRFASITSGYDHTCGLDESGRAYCWGNNDQGQLGVGDGQAR